MQKTQRLNLTNLAALAADPVTPQPTGTGLLAGSSEQQDIWREMLTGQGHILVNAVAGSGKSTTCIEGAKRLQSRWSVSYLAFNKHIQAEMQQRAGGVLSAKTFHATGLAAVTRALGRVTVDPQRMWAVVEGIREWGRGERGVLAGVKQLSSLAKQYNAVTAGELEHILDFHGIDCGGEEQDRQATALTPVALDRAREFTRGQPVVIDYDDMCWLPVVLDLKMDRVGVSLIDEAQDLNPVQQWLALRSGIRLVIVGDRRQAIYSFRGADTRSMDNLAAMAEIPGGIDGLGTRPVKEYPLSFTRRCPVSHVALAQMIVPGIQALPTAIDGSWGLRTPAMVVSWAGPGDMILSRTNAPLIEMAYQLIGAGKRSVIKGRDVGKGILGLLDQANSRALGGDLKRVLADARTLTDTDIARFTAMRGGRGEMRASMAEDRLQCLLTAAIGCATVADLTRKLLDLFTDDDTDAATVVTLGTVHKCKGLEADRVTILRPELMPHPMATKPHEIEQEYNCLYVALTRSRRELWFCGQLPQPLLAKP